MAAEPAINASQVAQIPICECGVADSSNSGRRTRPLLLVRSIEVPFAYAAGGRLSSRSIRPFCRVLGGEDRTVGVERLALWVTVARSTVRFGTRNKRLFTRCFRISF